MRILMLTQFFFPEPGPRVHELAAELAARGHHVSVITGFPTVPLSTFYDGYRPRIYRRDRYGDAEVIRVPHFPHGQKSVFARLLHYGSFALSASLIGNRLASKADCMYVFLPPPLLGYTARLIAGIRGIPFMYDIQDIWPDAIFASGISLPKILSTMLEHFSLAAYRMSTTISVPSPGYKRHLAARGIDSQNIHFIPNWADEESSRPLDYDHGFSKQFGLLGKFNVTFAGNLGLAQALDSVLDAAALLTHIPSIQFVLAGDGVALNGLQKKSFDLGITNVRFLGRLPPSQMPSLFSVSDTMLVHLRKEPIFQLTIPSKTQAYMASGKPLLMAVEGDAKDLIETTRSGLTCPPEDPVALAHCVQRLYCMTASERMAMGRNARLTYLKRFTRKVIVSQFEELLIRTAETVSRNPRRG